MPQRITLAHFHATRRGYHIYRIRSSTVSHQTHYHDYYQVCFVSRGQVLHGQEDREIALMPGDAFIIPPGFIHSLHFCDVYSEIYSLSFSPALFRTEPLQSHAQEFLAGLQKGILPQSGEPVRLRIPLDKSRRDMLRKLLDCLLQQQETPCRPELSAAPGMVAAVLYLLAQCYYEQPRNADSFDALVVWSSALVQCTEYMDAHFQEELTLDELARKFGMSRSRFHTLFSQFTGVSPAHYLSQKRILEAQLLIRAHPELALHQVASRVGYSDTSTFYRNFLKVSGVSPSQYRTLAKNGKKPGKISENP